MLRFDALQLNDGVRVRVCDAKEASEFFLGLREVTRNSTCWLLVVQAAVRKQLDVDFVARLYAKEVQWSVAVIDLLQNSLIRRPIVGKEGRRQGRSRRAIGAVGGEC